MAGKGGGKGGGRGEGGWILNGSLRKIRGKRNGGGGGIGGGGGVGVNIKCYLTSRQSQFYNACTGNQNTDLDLTAYCYHTEILILL